MNWKGSSKALGGGAAGRDLGDEGKGFPQRFVRGVDHQMMTVYRNNYYNMNKLLVCDSATAVTT